MEELPARLADALESVATRVRNLTADRLESWIRASLFFLVSMVFAFLGLIYLLVAVHRALAIWLGPAGSLAALGGLFSIAGLFIWNKGTPPRGAS